MVYCPPAPCPYSGLCVRECDDLWWSFTNMSEEGVEIQRSSRPAVAASSREPHRCVPTARMQAASELSALGFQLLGRDVSNSQLSQVVSSARFGQRCPERGSTETSFSQEAALHLEDFICMLDVWGLGRKSPQKLQAFLTPATPAGAPAASARELFGCSPWISRDGSQLCR